MIMIVVSYYFTVPKYCIVVFMPLPFIVNVLAQVNIVCCHNIVEYTTKLHTAGRPSQLLCIKYFAPILQLRKPGV